MKFLFIILFVGSVLTLHAQSFGLNVGVGSNITNEETSVNHSLASLVVFIEPSYHISANAQIRYSLEPGVKFEGEVVQTSLPPQKYGTNYLINQYLKYLQTIGQTHYIGLGYLLHYQRPYTTRFGEQGGVLATERFHQFGHGTSAYAGIKLSYRIH